MASAASRTSHRKLRMSRCINDPPGALDICQDKRVAHRTRHDEINRSAKQCCQFIPQIKIVGQAWRWRTWVVGDQQVNVGTVWVEVGAARGRAEHVQSVDVEAPAE